MGPIAGVALGGLCLARVCVQEFAGDDKVLVAIAELLQQRRQSFAELVVRPRVLSATALLC